MHYHNHHPEMHQHPDHSPQPIAGEACGCHQRSHHHAQAAGPILYGDHDRVRREGRCTCGCHDRPRTVERCACGRHHGPHTEQRCITHSSRHHPGFRRRLFTREEKIARLLRYLNALYTEAEAVEERLAALGVDLELLDEDLLDEEDMNETSDEGLEDEGLEDEDLGDEDLGDEVGPSVEA